MLLIGRWNQGKIVAKRFHWYLYHGGNIKAVFDQEPVFDGELKILEMNFAWWVILLNLQTCIWWDVFCNRVSNFERGQCNVWNWDCFKGWAKLSCLSHMLSGLLISAIKNTNVTSLHLNVLFTYAEFDCFHVIDWLYTHIIFTGVSVWHWWPLYVVIVKTMPTMVNGLVYWSMQCRMQIESVWSLSVWPLLTSQEKISSTLWKRWKKCEA